MINEYTVLTTLAFHHLVIGFVLIALLALIHKLFVTSAELKSWLWMTAFVVSTVVPFSLISFDTGTTQARTTGQAQVAQATQNQSRFVVPENVVNEPEFWHLPTSIVFSFSYLLSAGLILWSLGCAWRAFLTLQSFWRTRGLLGSSRRQLSALSEFIGVKVFASDKVSSPLVVGFIKPQIILPESITEQLQDNQLQAILLHELAHIQRKDNWFGLFQEILAILFWWSPVVRVLNQRIHVEREIACDLRAAAKLESNKQYAQSLLDCAKLMVNEQRNVLAMGLFSKKKELSHRVGAVLTRKSIKGPHKFLIALLCAGLSVSTLQAAQTFSPKISVKQTHKDARHYSLLPEQDGLMLINAVSRNDISAIKRLQDDGVDIDTPALGDGTALMLAVKSNNFAMVQSLLDLGADVDQSSEGDGNPLIVAAMTNNMTLAEYLLDRGANIDAVVPRDETALINATRNGYVAMTEMLIARGADVNLSVETGYWDGYEVRSPLNQASNQRIIDLLIANGATEELE